MTRSMKFVGAAALSLFGLAAVGMAADEGFGRGERHGHGMHGRGFDMRGLNLTDDQKAQLKEMRDQQHNALKPVMEQHRQLREQIEQALESGNADAARIGQLEIQAYTLRKQLQAGHEKMEAAFMNILTPEQKAQWEKMQQERKQRFEQFREQREQKQ